MDKTEILKKLIKEEGYSIRAFAEKCEIPYTSLYTILNKTGVSKAGVDVIINICKNLSITVDDLDRMATGKTKPEPTFDELNILIARNGKNLTTEEKQELIKTLLSDD